MLPGQTLCLGQRPELSSAYALKLAPAFRNSSNTADRGHDRGAAFGENIFDRSSNNYDNFLYNLSWDGIQLIML